MEKTLISKNIILNEVVGRSPWFNTDGKCSDAYVIGIGGGSASGKTRVAQEILKQLGVPWVVVLAQDNFYKSLSAEQSRNAFQNNHDFDCPEALDYNSMNDAIRNLKHCEAVQIPTYSFTLHQRTEETTYLYGATVIIVEGIFALHDKETRDLCDLKVFVQCDSDVMLARRLRRDLVERGRDAEGVIDQYLRYVKPSFDSYILPTSKFADVIVPGSNNEISINLMASHIRRELDERKTKMRIREELSTKIGQWTGLPMNLIVMDETKELKKIHAILADLTTPSVNFVLTADKLSDVVIFKAVSLSFGISRGPPPPPTLNSNKSKQITPPKYPNLAGISILRSGAVLEKSLNKFLKSEDLGSILIDTDSTTGESLLYNLQLPTFLTSNRTSASEAKILLLDSQIGTGSAGILAIRILLDHGVLEENIIFTTLLVSQCGGIWSILKAFPKVRIITSKVDNTLEERWVWPKDDCKIARGPKKVWSIIPGFGSFSERYYGV